MDKVLSDSSTTLQLVFYSCLAERIRRCVSHTKRRPKLWEEAGGLEGVSWHTQTTGLTNDWQSVEPTACTSTACIQSEGQLPSYPEPLDGSLCGIC